MTTQSRGLALVTGASAGIGAVYAARLAKRGYDLILVARREDKLQALAKQINAETGRVVEIISANLGNRDGMKKVENVLQNDARITMLVNNAGVGAIFPLLESKVDAMSEIITVNIESLVRLTYAVAPAFVARGKGTIINIGSAVGIGTEILNGVYSGSKAFVLAFSQSLQNELADKGVRIQAVLPGATATDIWAKSGSHHDNLPKEMVMATDDMVDAALVGLDLGEFMTAPSLPNIDDWDNYDAARQKLAAQLSASRAAARYRTN